MKIYKKNSSKFLLLIIVILCSCGKRRIDEKYAAALVKDKLSLTGTVSAEKLAGGFSGAPLFTATAPDSKKYVVRILSNKSPEERKREIDTLQIASQENYGPHIYFANSTNGIVIMEYLNNKEITLQQRKSDKLYIELAHLLQKIHHGPHLQNSSSIFDTITKYLGYISEYHNDAIPLAKLEKIEKIVHQAILPYITTTPCHNDLHPRNVMFLGNEFRAIDYEFMAESYPYSDIATIAIFYCHSPQHEKTLLKTYLEHEPSPKEQAQLYLMKQMSWIICALAFLKMVPEKVHLYQSFDVPSYLEFMREIGEGKINLDDPEDKLKFAKVMINHVITNSETKEFQDALNILQTKEK